MDDANALPPANVVGRLRETGSRGTPQPDVVTLGRSLDSLRGLRRGDLVCGGRNGGRVFPGGGTDWLTGGAANDILVGAATAQIPSVAGAGTISSGWVRTTEEIVRRACTSPCGTRSQETRTPFRVAGGPRMPSALEPLLELKNGRKKISVAFDAAKHLLQAEHERRLRPSRSDGLDFAPGNGGRHARQRRRAE